MDKQTNGRQRLDLTSEILTLKIKEILFPLTKKTPPRRYVEVSKTPTYQTRGQLITDKNTMGYLPYLTLKSSLKSDKFDHVDFYLARK